VQAQSAKVPECTVALWHPGTLAPWHLVSYGCTTQTAHTRNWTFERELPLPFRSETVQPSAVGADIAGVRNTEFPKPGVGSPVPVAMSGSQPPPTGRLPVLHCTAALSTVPFGTLAWNSLFTATVS
jgi:hypothetical protein